MSVIEPVYLKIGNKIEKLRETRGVTQDVLARNLDVTRAAISSMERGKQRILIHQLVAIASVLGVKTGDLLPDDLHSEEFDPSIIAGELAKNNIRQANIRSITAKLKNLSAKGAVK